MAAQSGVRPPPAPPNEMRGLPTARTTQPLPLHARHRGRPTARGRARRPRSSQPIAAAQPPQCPPTEAETPPLPAQSLRAPRAGRRRGHTPPPAPAGTGRGGGGGAAIKRRGGGQHLKASPCRASSSPSCCFSFSSASSVPYWRPAAAGVPRRRLQPLT